MNMKKVNEHMKYKNNKGKIPGGGYTAKKINTTILEKINQNASAYPDRLVMIQKDNYEENTLSWKQLHDYSDYLAYWLDKKLKTKTPIVVYGHKHPLMLVCFMACVKSGRAYCPVDVNVPLSRVEAIVGEVNPEIVLSTENLEIDSDVIIGLDELMVILENGIERISADKYVNAEDVFYIIFTSGSTGNPKGVQITRNCLDNFIKWAITLGNGIKEGKQYTFLNQAPFSFDLSVMDLFMCLYTGGTLWVLSKSVQSDMKSLYASIKMSKANIWVSTPSFADVCLADPVFAEELAPNLSEFLFCGEILTNKTVRRLMQRFPNAKIVNTYGPTECTCAVTEVVVTEELNQSCVPLPVGKARQGIWLRIVDEDGQIVNDGERGEIIIVGDSVSIGYWNDTERNKKSFGTTVEDGREYRFYRTGDEGYLVDGMLYYSGRIDLQVKLHGYRIELEDIENNLLKINGVVQAVVLPKYRDGKVSSLVAGIIASEIIEDEKAAVTEIRKKLKDNLPDYMVPKKIKFVSDIPRTNNGKIDRKAMEGRL